MSDCEKCGRDDGHNLGCPATLAEPVEERKDPAFWADADKLVAVEDLPSATFCAFGECRNPKRPKGKGPAPKYCEEHSDPKNRK